MAATTVSLRSVSLKAEARELASSKSASQGVRLVPKVAKAAVCKSANVTVCQVESESNAVSRRGALSLAAAVVAAVVSSEQSALAAYGDKANVFGSATPDTGFQKYAGEGFTVALPGKWNPSKEKDFPNTVLRYEDNFDAVSNVIITKSPGKNSIEEYGTPEAVLEQLSFMLGKSAYFGKTMSEGGFAPGQIARANVLDVSSKKDRTGTTYYNFEILTLTADGDEGGRHQLIKAGAKNGTLYVIKAQSGDKRWFKGQERFVRGMMDSFSIS